MTIYKVGCKISDAAIDIEYIDAEDEESAAMMYDRFYHSTYYYKEFFVKKLGLFRITTHVVKIPILPSGIEYKILRKAWKPLAWFN
jgi:hypothetical protein